MPDPSDTEEDTVELRFDSAGDQCTVQQFCQTFGGTPENPPQEWLDAPVVKTRSAPPARRDGSLLQTFRTRRPTIEYLDHDEERWVAEFNSYGNGTTSPDMVKIRAMRLLIQTQTLAVCEAGRYFVRVDPDEDVGAALPEGVPPAQQPASGSPRPEMVEVASGSPRPEMVEVLLQPSERRRTVLYLPSSGVSTTSAGMSLTPRAHRNGGIVGGGASGYEVPVDAATSSPPLAAAGPIEVKSTDCLEEARALLTNCEPGERVAVLNMANAFTPGGGFRAGCGAQEENLHRRSDLHLFLEDERAWQPLDGKPMRFYPIPSTGALYSRDVRVFRGPEAKGYPMLTDPFTIDVVSCAAISHPMLSSATRLSPVAEDDLRIKIRSLLAACQEHGARDH
eukprot:COSAG02_NODE_13575_length_1377_cov_1.219875_1_plen_392_part_10